MGLSADDSEDAASQAVLQFLVHGHKLKSPRAVHAWFKTAAFRIALRTISERRRTVELDPSFDGRDESAETAFDQAVSSSLDDHGVIKELNDRQREVLRLLVHEGLSYRDVASRTGLQLGSIGPTRARIIRKLRGSPSFIDGPLQRS